MTTAADVMYYIRETLSEDFDPAPATLMIFNKELAHLLAAWPNVPRSSFDEDADCTLVPSHAQVRWLWSILDPDPVPIWIQYAGLPDAPHVRRAVSMAIDNRLAHPDGKISYHARKLVQSTARRAARGF